MKTTGLEVTPSLRALLGGSVDYAGLFPPAALTLEPALDNYAAYLRSEEAWMLGCFVLPVAKFTEVRRLLDGRFDADGPLRISALGAKTGSAEEFLDGLRADLRALADFQTQHGPAVAIEQLEAPLPPDTPPGPALVSLLRAAAALLDAETPGSLRPFWEIPFSDALPMILCGFAEHNASAARPCGAKLRTGGLEAAAFPSPERLAFALIAARHSGVALKFTAGLHHPFRRSDAGVGARMHGFVNVLAAGVFLRQPQTGAVATLVQDILEDEDPANFCFDADGLRWREWTVPTPAITEARALVTSFGSCSFDEPRDDLRAAGLLP